MSTIPDMKIQHSKTISSFGGINFVFAYLKELGTGAFFDSHLPSLATQSSYAWSDIINSLLSVYFCGGDHIEDLHTHLKPHFKNNPYLQLASPDTVLRRLKELSEENRTCRTKRGTVDHTYNTNSRLAELNIRLLKKLGVFANESLTLDYDNTFIFNEKSDSKMTYKRNPGYQPGVCTVNEEQVLYIEGRNGNSDAKSFQEDTLNRMFNLLKANAIKKINHFRADAASYQWDVVKLLDKRVENFYIGCRNSYVEKYFYRIENWESIMDENQDKEIMQIGEILITPFENHGNKKQFRLIVKRKPREDGQMNMITQDAYEYGAILTNNMEWKAIKIAQFYNHRGNMEKQFDILKNDFGWKYMPFSKLNQNTVFLYFAAICRNLYHHVIRYFAKKTKHLKSTFRLKKFLFRFIILPAVWVRRGRQYYLRIYGKLYFPK
jgi:hypothetical protein